MAQFDLFRADTGYLLDVQTDLLGAFNTRLAVPLMPPDVAPVPERRLNPTFLIEGQPYVMVTQYLTAIRARDLGRPVGSLDPHYDKIVAAINMIFLGF